MGILNSLVRVTVKCTCVGLYLRSSAPPELQWNSVHNLDLLKPPSTTQPMLADLPAELLHEIVILACPLIQLSYDPKSPPAYNSIEVSPPAAVARIAQTCSTLNAKVEYTKNALLYAQIFERSFDFDAARRRLGSEWAGPHGLAWEGKRRWITIKRMKAVVVNWEHGEWSYQVASHF